LRAQQCLEERNQRIRNTDWQRGFAEEGGSRRNFGARSALAQFHATHVTTATQRRGGKRMLKRFRCIAAPPRFDRTLAAR
jgi:hypothetical protein